MAYQVVQHGKYSPEYLRNNSRVVIQLLNDTAQYWNEPAQQSGNWKLTGPDGLTYETQTYSALEFAEFGWNSWDFQIQERDDGLILISVMSGRIGNMGRSLSVAPWVVEAFSRSPDEATNQLLAQLAFGQLPVSVAANLVKLKTADIGANLHGKGCNQLLSHLLRTSVTKATFSAESTLIDLRGMLAWLLLTNQEKAEPVAETK
jgi:hypothetical protein